MAISVNDGGVNKDVNEILIKDGGVWKRANEVYIKDNGTWKLAFGVTYVDLSGLQKNYNLGTSLGLTSPTIISVTIADNTNFVSTSNTVPAFDVGTLPVGSTVRISLPSSASITGRGGNGGYGSNGNGSGGIAGDFGGTGLYTRFPISLTNNGLIGGGGGGGGAGGWGGGAVSNPAGNGGGGAGGYHEDTNSTEIIASDGTTGISPGSSRTISAGFGGIGAGPRQDGASSNTSPAASDGTKTTGGTGGNQPVPPGRVGGNGGNLGVAGTSGSWAGGAAGNAIDGHSYITYVTSGTISGGQVN